jgi:hypothetical protein
MPQWPEHFAVWPRAAGSGNLIADSIPQNFVLVSTVRSIRGHR